MDSLSKAVYVSEQVCMRWCRTGAYYTAKLTFSHGFPVKVWDAYYTTVRIIFEFLPYLLWRGQGHVMQQCSICLLIQLSLKTSQLKTVTSKRERKSIYVAPFCTKVHTKRSGMDHTVLPANNTMPAFPSWRSQDVTTTATEAADIHLHHATKTANIKNMILLSNTSPYSQYADK